MNRQKILVWLPGPMGDAIMSTAALRGIREVFSGSEITFLANSTVRGVLSPSGFCDRWIELKSKNPFKIAAMLRGYDFDSAVLFKNSIASAISVFLARIPVRVGYGREMRSVFLTDALRPEKKNLFSYRPVPAVDYYLAISSWLGAEIENRRTQLQIEPGCRRSVLEKFPDIAGTSKPLVILVPGSAFGPSKCWAEINFAKTADCLIEKYDVNLFISVSRADAEKQTAEKIYGLAEHKERIFNLAQNPLSLGQLKALFSFAAVVITNDTGPRHIAIALGRKVITMFGPNDPARTDNGYAGESRVIADVDCAPCDKPVCGKKRHYCMESITPKMVCEIADKILGCA